MQRNLLIHLIITIVLASLIVACSSKAADDKKQQSVSAASPVKLPVDVKIVEVSTLQQTEAVAGSVLPNRTVDIMSELSKKIVTVAFKDGSHVSQGQVLYQLDASDIHARIRQLQADLNLAKINEARLNQLLKTETVRQEEYDIALAKLQSLQAENDLLHVELAKTSIRAPFSGIIGITRVYAGTLVSPGMPLVSLQEQSTVKVQFTVSEKYLPLLKTGSKIPFSTELNDEKLSATIVSTEASVDMQSRTITVQAIASNADGKLKAGMSAKVFFNTAGENNKAIMIPTESLIPGNNGYSVFVVKNGAATTTPVTIANRNEEEALITSGLKNGDTVMVSNILRAGDGTPVTVITYK